MMLVLLYSASLFLTCLCYPTGHIGDSQEARRLFRKADKDHNHILTRAEFHQVFLDFDLDGNKEITNDEFVTDWAIQNLGPPSEAVVLFHNVDVNKDGVLTEDIDLLHIFHYFDHDEDGDISEAEFTVQWVKMGLS